ncbi:hypothetical protein Taro_008325 [Colocasia esculenta]|uniref:Uncharacterized protein n=1 Tax=Colocasia esculenta TaxID=4460 RepID=A0A843U1I2_COLES|nr:hypothetical protein [Colocasia esculenta]
MVLLTWLLGVSRGDTWLFLPDLVEVWDIGCLCRVVFGLTLFCFHFVGVPAALDGTDSLSQEFIAGRLWWRLVRRALPALSVGGGATFGGPSRGSERSGRYSGIRAQGSNEICNELITMAVPKKGECLLLLLGAHAARVVAVFARAAVGFVLGMRIRVGPTCGVAFTGAGLWPAEPIEVVNSSEVLLEFFSIGSGGSEVSVVGLVTVALPSRLRCITWLPCVLVVLVRFALKTNDALVVLVEDLPEPVVLLPLAAVFSLLAVCFGHLFGLRSCDVFPERLLALLVEVLPKAALVGSLASILTPYGCLASVVGVALAVPPVGVLALRCCFPLSREEEACCVPSSSSFRGLLGVVVLAWQLVSCFALWRPLWRRSLPLCCLEVELVAPLVHVFSLWCDRAVSPVFSVRRHQVFFCLACLCQGRKQLEATGSRPGRVELLGGGGKLCRPRSGAEARAAGVMLEPGQLARWSCEGNWVRAVEVGRWAIWVCGCGGAAGARGPQRLKAGACRAAA